MPATEHGGPEGVYILDAVRTPIGRYGGGLAGVRPDDLAAAAISALLGRHLDLDPALVDDVVLGDANGAGEDNRNVARMALLLAGLPTSVPGTTVNRLCGSGMEAVAAASRAIALRDARICIAGGVESMSRAPFVLPKPEAAYPRADATLYSSTLGWRMVNPAMPKEWTVSLGEGAELLAERGGVSREEQDAFALHSHEKAAAAWADGAFADEVVPVPGAAIDLDESVRAHTSASALAALRPAFRPNGTVTPGNSSPLNDGASALLLVAEGELHRFAAPPLARIAARAVTALDPPLYGLGPVEAVATAVARAGRSLAEVSVLELNEAFAAQALACLRSWPELDPKVVNPLGGAIALGHPIGCSGARILTTLSWQLRHGGGGLGLATMCIGVGQGIAVLLEA